MKLPFVSRSVYEFRVGYSKGLESGMAALQSKFDQLFDNYSQLVDHVVKMKHDGFGLPVELPDIELAEISPEVRTAILERAVPGTRTYKELHGWAVEQARLGLSTEEIVSSILKGGEY